MSADILEAARAIRPYLRDLLGAESVTVDRTLEDLLAKAASGESKDDQIIELLSEHDATREWTRQFLSDETPTPVRRGYNPLAGSPSVIGANKFVCPVPGCPRVWYRPKAGIASPICQEHKTPLVLAQAQTD